MQELIRISNPENRKVLYEGPFRHMQLKAGEQIRIQNDEGEMIFRLFKDHCRLAFLSDHQSHLLLDPDRNSAVKVISAQGEFELPVQLLEYEWTEKYCRIAYTVEGQQPFCFLLEKVRREN